MSKKRAQVLIEFLISALSFIYLCVNFSLLALFIFLLSIAQLILFRISMEESPNLESKEEEEPKIIEEEIEEETEEEITEENNLDFPEDFDEKAFAKAMFLLYREIQVDFMNFRYEKLMTKLGLEMYEQFSKQLRHLEESGKQAVRNNIELQKIQIISFTQEENFDLAVVHLSVLEDKYMKKEEEPMRLTSVGVRYESCYALTVAKNYKKRIVKKCSNCGEKVQGNPFICPNCENMLQESIDDWILKDLKLVASKSYSQTKKES